MDTDESRLFNWRRPIRWLLLVAAAGSTLGLSRSAFGAVATHLGEDQPHSTNVCDSVCQIRSQDWAFALLIETYREYRCNQIEVDYANRTRAAANLAKIPDANGVVHAPLQFVQQLQELLGDIAAAERNRGLQLIHTQVNNFQTLYDCARKNDEQALGVSVAKTVDSRVVASELKHYVVLKPQAPSRSADPADLRMPPPSLVVSPKYLAAHAPDAETEPAGNLLYYEPSVPVDKNLLLTPCE